MQAQTLAEQFNDVSAELERRGHGVVVRRARAFIEAGRVADAVEFLHRAQASMASDRAVAGLSSGLRAFHEAGADAAALARTTAWREGVEREAQVAHAVDTHMSRSGLLPRARRQSQRLSRSRPPDPPRRLCPSRASSARVAPPR
jgi:thioredoxin-like negative regulator of GroEL